MLDQTGTSENRYLYTGEQFDASLDQYYLRARYYNPANGRFTQMDTYQGRMQEPVTLHKYLYVNGDPINVIDPSGKVGLTEKMVTVSLLTYLVGSAIVETTRVNIKSDSHLAIGLSVLDSQIVSDKEKKLLSNTFLSERDDESNVSDAVDSALDKCKEKNKGNCRLQGPGSKTVSTPKGWKVCHWICDGWNVRRYWPIEVPCPDNIYPAPGIPLDTPPPPRNVGGNVPDLSPQWRW